MGEKTYQGKTMKEALAKVRKDLGGDAVILASREVRRRRLFGLGPRELIEVTASATMPSAAVHYGFREPRCGSISRGIDLDAVATRLSPCRRRAEPPSWP